MPNVVPINKPFINQEEICAAVEVLKSGVLTSKNGAGLHVSRLEKAFSEYIGSKYAIALNSGTAALHASLLAVGMKKNDEAIVPSFTFVATAEAVAMTGAKPVFVDIDPKTYCIDPMEVESAITSRTRAIIPVHLYGLTADMDHVLEIAEDHSLVVIEDAAQAHGAEYKKRKAGNLGDISCFSFYGSKSMVTGEGGMVTTSNEEYAAMIRLLRNHGEAEEYQSIVFGHNYRMPELEAAIGLVQLRRLPTFLEIRERNATILSTELQNLEELQLPFSPKGYRHAWYVFTVRLRKASVFKRNKIVGRIRGQNIEACIYYPKPIHLLPLYLEVFGSFKLPTTEAAADQVFSLPVHPCLHEEEVGRIIDAVKTSIRKEG